MLAKSGSVEIMEGRMWLKSETTLDHGMEDARRLGLLSNHGRGIGAAIGISMRKGRDNGTKIGY
jgi:hypothetical protein